MPLVAFPQLPDAFAGPLQKRLVAINAGAVLHEPVQLVAQAGHGFLAGPGVEQPVDPGQGGIRQFPGRRFVGARPPGSRRRGVMPRDLPEDQ